MNDLSWFIYFADVIPQLSTALCISTFLLFFPVTFLYICGITEGFGDWRRKGDEEHHLVTTFKKFKSYCIVLFLLWLLSFVVPGDRNTYYAIAASEMGEEMLNSPVVTKASKALENWLDKQLAETKQEASAEKGE